MIVGPNQAITTDFRVKNAEGELVDADSLPTGVLFRNGSATAVVVTIAGITGDGRYSASWTNAGYSFGDQLRMEVTAVVGVNSYTSVVWGATVGQPANEVITTGLLFIPDSTIQFSTPDPGVGGVPSWRLLIDNTQVATGTGASVVDGGSLITVEVPPGATPGATAELVAEWGSGVYQRFVGLVADTDNDIATETKQDEILAAVAAKTTVSILPTVGIVAQRAPGATLTPMVGELVTESITLYESDGVTPYSLAGRTLAIPFEDRRGVDVDVIEDADITVSGADNNVVSFDYTPAITESERTLRFAIKDAGSPFTEHLKGICIVTRGPMVDS